jgi:hypothetical protein
LLADGVTLEQHIAKLRRRKNGNASHRHLLPAIEANAKPRLRRGLSGMPDLEGLSSPR